MAGQRRQIKKFVHFLLYSCTSNKFYNFSSIGTCCLKLYYKARNVITITVRNIIQVMIHESAVVSMPGIKSNRKLRIETMEIYGRTTFNILHII